MSEQEVMFLRHGNTEVPITARLLARRDDPATSKRAAVTVARSGRIGLELSGFLLHLRLSDGGLTCKEAARKTTDPGYWAFRWNSRVKAWATAGHIVCVGERDGSRVWAVREEE